MKILFIGETLRVQSGGVDTQKQFSMKRAAAALLAISLLPISRKKQAKKR